MAQLSPFSNPVHPQIKLPVPSTSDSFPFYLPQYSSLKALSTQHNRPYQPPPTRLFCRTDRLYISPCFALLSPLLYTAFPPPSLPRPYQRSLQFSTYTLSLLLHREKRHSLFHFFGIAPRISGQLCPSYLNYLNSSSRFCSSSSLIIIS